MNAFYFQGSYVVLKREEQKLSCSKEISILILNVLHMKDKHSNQGSYFVLYKDCNIAVVIPPKMHVKVN